MWQIGIAFLSVLAFFTWQRYCPTVRFFVIKLEKVTAWPLKGSVKHLNLCLHLESESYSLYFTFSPLLVFKHNNLDGSNINCILWIFLESKCSNIRQVMFKGDFSTSFFLLLFLVFWHRYYFYSWSQCKILLHGYWKQKAQYSCFILSFAVQYMRQTMSHKFLFLSVISQCVHWTLIFTYIHTGMICILFHFNLDLIDCKYYDTHPHNDNPLFSVDLATSIFDFK